VELTRRVAERGDADNRSELGRERVSKEKREKNPSKKRDRGIRQVLPSGAEGGILLSPGRAPRPGQKPIDHEDVPEGEWEFQGLYRHADRGVGARRGVGTERTARIGGLTAARPGKSLGFSEGRVYGGAAE